MKYKEVSVWVPPNPPQRLASEDIAPKPGFEGPYEYELPATFFVPGLTAEIVPGANHLAAASQPQAVNDAILAFLMTPTIAASA